MHISVYTFLLFSAYLHAYFGNLLVHIPTDPIRLTVTYYRQIIK